MVKRREKEGQDFDEVELKGRKKIGKAKRGQKNPEAINSKLEAQAGQERQALEDSIEKVTQTQEQIGDEAAAFSAESDELLPEATETQEAQLEMLNERARAAAAQATEALDVIKNELDTTVREEMLQEELAPVPESAPVVPENTIPEAKKRRFLKDFKTKLYKDLDNLEFLDEESINKVYVRARTATAKKLKLDLSDIEPLEAELTSVLNQYSGQGEEADAETTETGTTPAHIFSDGKNGEILAQLKDALGSHPDPVPSPDLPGPAAPKKATPTQDLQPPIKTLSPRVRKPNANRPKRIDIDEFVRHDSMYERGSEPIQPIKLPKQEEQQPAAERSPFAAEVDAHNLTLTDLLNEVSQLPNEHQLSESAQTVLGGFVKSYRSQLQKLASFGERVTDPEKLALWKTASNAAERELGLAKEYLISLEPEAVVTLKDLENYLRQQVTTEPVATTPEPADPLAAAKALKEVIERVKVEGEIPAAKLEGVKQELRHTLETRKNNLQELIDRHPENPEVTALIHECVANLDRRLVGIDTLTTEAERAELVSEYFRAGGLHHYFEIKLEADSEDAQTVLNEMAWCKAFVAEIESRQELLAAAGEMPQLLEQLKASLNKWDVAIAEDTSLEAGARAMNANVVSFNLASEINQLLKEHDLRTPVELSPQQGEGAVAPTILTPDEFDEFLNNWAESTTPFPGTEFIKVPSAGATLEAPIEEIGLSDAEVALLFAKWGTESDSPSPEPQDIESGPAATAAKSLELDGQLGVEAMPPLEGFDDDLEKKPSEHFYHQWQEFAELDNELINSISNLNPEQQEQYRSVHNQLNVKYYELINKVRDFKDQRAAKTGQEDFDFELETEAAYTDFSKELDLLLTERKTLLEQVIEVLLDSPEAQQIKEDIEKLPKAEQEKIALGLHNIGFKAKEKKSQFLAGMYKKLGSDQGTGKLFKALADTYDRDAERARNQIERAQELKAGKGGKVASWMSTGTSAAIAVGMGAKIGRLVAGTSVMPLPRVMLAAAMGTARLSEAGKEARLAGKEDQVNLLDPERQAQAWEKYQQDQAASGKTETELLEDFKKLSLTRDLRQRLKQYQEPAKSLNVIQKVAQWNTDRVTKNIRRQIIGITLDKKRTAEEKQVAKLEVIRKYTTQLKDLDRMVSEYGEVDMVATGLKALEKTSKAAVLAMTLETLGVSAYSLGHKVMEIDTDKLWSQVIGLVCHENQAEHHAEHHADQIVNVAGGHSTTEPVAATPEAHPAKVLTAKDVPLPPPGGVKVGNTVELSTTAGATPSHVPAPEATPAPSAASGTAPEVHSTAPATTPDKAPVPASPAPEIAKPTNIPAPDTFKTTHGLFEKSGATVSTVENHHAVTYEIGAKGGVQSLDQALRRIVASEISVGADNKFDALEATRAENVVANLHQIIDGKSISGIKPEDLKGVVEFHDGKLVISNYDQFNSNILSKLFKHAEDIKAPNELTGYGQTSAAKWQEMFDANKPNVKVDLNTLHETKPAASAVHEAKPVRVPPASQAVHSARPVTEIQALTPKEAPLLEKIVIKTDARPADYAGDVLQHLKPAEATELSNLLVESKVTPESWHAINEVITKNIGLLETTDGRPDSDQVKLALELATDRKYDGVPVAVKQLALEATRTMQLPVAQERIIIDAITDRSKAVGHLERLFGKGSPRSAMVEINPRKGLLIFRNIGSGKWDGRFDFHKGTIKIGSFMGRVFGKKLDLKKIMDVASLLK